jgi:23S rRNA pseudouridine1911/1915/1917 synthase
MEIRKVRITAELAGLRLDTCLARALPELSRAQIKRLIEAGKVRGPFKVKPAEKVQAGWQFEVDLEPPEQTLKPEPVAFEVVYTDDDLIVVNKPAGLVVHPAPGNRAGTLVHGLLDRVGELASLGSPLRPGIVHRLDKETSGLLVVARSDSAYKSLTEQISQRTAVRRYTAVVCGRMTRPEGTIEAAIGRSRSDRRQMRVDRAGRDALTRFRVIETAGPCDVLRLTLESGRTHQIRVHMRHVGKPVLGDPTYGGRGRWVSTLPVDERRKVQAALKVLPRQALHAVEIRFTHPRSGMEMRFTSELPEDMQQVLEILKG